jgi:hypothetical protein
VNPLRGAVGLAKARLGIDKAPPRVVALRREVCMLCPQRLGWLCAECKCIIHEKTKVASERCPLGVW